MARSSSEANEAGIPVFTADIACLEPEAKVVSHIATDNYGGGKQAGEAMIEALGEAGGKVVILDYEAGRVLHPPRQGLSSEVIDAHNESRENGKIEIVAELPGDGKNDEGYKAAEDALQAHPDLAGIFAINDPSALGAWAALEKAGKADQVKIVGFDGQPEGKQAIKDGKIFADPIQYPDQIGKTDRPVDPQVSEWRRSRRRPAHSHRLLPASRRPEGSGAEEQAVKRSLLLSLVREHTTVLVLVALSAPC